MAMPVSDTLITVGNPLAQTYCKKRFDGKRSAAPLGVRAKNTHRGIVAHHQPEKHAGNRRYQHLRQSLRGFGERRLLHGVDGNHNHNHHAPIRKRDSGHLHQSAPLQQP